MMFPLSDMFVINSSKLFLINFTRVLFVVESSNQFPWLELLMMQNYNLSFVDNYGSDIL